MWSVFQGHVVEEYFDPVDERTALLWTVGKPYDPSQGAGFNSRKTHHTRHSILIIIV